MIGYLRYAPRILTHQLHRWYTFDKWGGGESVYRIHMFLGLSDPYPLVRGMDPDPSIILTKYLKKNLDSYCFVASFGLFIFKKW
jgi:hypothetical protein